MPEKIITENSHKTHEELKNLQPEDKFNHIESLFSSPLDSKIYIFFAVTGVIFLFYSIWQIKPVVVDINDFLGLLSHLTLAYWIGYALVVLFSIRLYLDKKIKHDIIYLMYLVIIGLFLFSVPIFAEDNARFAWSYYPAGEVKTVLETKYIDSGSDYPLMTYRSWPAMHLISAFILYLTDIKIENLLKYMPLFWVISVVLITFSIGKRLRLLSSQSFMASFLILASLWTGLYYYGPPSLAYLLYMLLFMFIVIFNKFSLNVPPAEALKHEYIDFIKDKIINIMLISMAFIALVITHVLTPIAVISSFIFSSPFIQTFRKKRIRFIIVFLILFIAWYVYLAPVMFETGIKEFVTQAMQLDFLSFFKTEKYSPGEFLTRWIVHYSRLFFLGIYAIAMIVAYAFYMTGRTKRENIELTKICFFWLAGVLALFALKYGRNEIDDRIFLFSLLPMVYIITFTFDRRILAILAILLILFHMPAHYGTESFDSVRTTELSGAKFFTTNAVFDNRETYFSMWDTFIDYYNPEMIKVLYWTMPVADKPDPSRIGNATYIINSDGSHNFISYSFGSDPLKEWIQLNQGKLSLFYNNGFYQIYKNKQ
ncbi:hypothetical protein [Candidatus Methanoperedens nitratireducens]|uniref:Glycosyltransferase RgtA/B/C/D-like domain-containing protein n=1 Tax=Candidatus Methanoperedens nitratireducens TaxID=1392998 RepID=A0A284VQN6_9EURY|nr:hypothetical protein [Candidatus Methanoperedens nitroreducens]SNQ61518.1 membrane hypothetical protein [Candidatus Methanoperedens nitroreducens]